MVKEEKVQQEKQEEKQEFNAVAMEPKPIKLSNGKTIYLQPPSVGLMRYISEQAQKSEKMFMNQDFADELVNVKTKEQLANVLPMLSKKWIEQMFESYDLIPELIQLIVDGKKPGTVKKKDHILSIEEIQDELNVFDIKAIVDEYRRLVDVSNFSRITKMLM
jgi:hypothetical protein